MKMQTSKFNLMDIVRPNLRGLEPYRCARDDYSEGILLDANENSYGPPLEDDQSLVCPEWSAAWLLVPARHMWGCR